MKTIDQINNAMLNALYIDAAADLFGPHGLKAASHPQSMVPNQKAAYISVLGASGSYISISSMLTIDADMLKSIHPMAPAEVSKEDLEDWCRELNNQIVGRMKNKLLQRGISVSLGLPVLLTGTDVTALPISNPDVNQHAVVLENGSLTLTLTTFVDQFANLPDQSATDTAEQIMLEGSVALF